MTEKESYIRKFYPPKFDQDTALPMTVFYAILFFAGVPGNLLTCFIILLNSYMRAPPNFFLFNLAIVDIITLTIGKFCFYNFSLATWITDVSMSMTRFDIFKPINMQINFEINVKSVS